MRKFKSSLVASCGMNYGVCIAYLRESNLCHGCEKVEENSPKTRVSCKIRNCTERSGKYCFGCDRFPCDRLKRLDKRYRTKYGMSELKNLEFIRDRGIDDFIESERKRWQTAKGTFCVHDKKYH